MRLVRFLLGDSTRPGIPAGDEIVDLSPVSRTMEGLIARGLNVVEAIEAQLDDLPRQPLADVEILAPLRPASLRDFLAFEDHAKAGAARRGEELNPAWYEMPVYYKGNHRSILGPGQPLVWPSWTEKLDFETEVACILGARGRDLTEDEAQHAIFGYTIMNDWSARDVQRWEYQPLGPFLAKSFGTTVSPWVVTLDALEPFRVPRSPRPEGDPPPLPYLDGAEDRSRGGLDLGLTVSLRSARMREEGMEPMRVSCGRFAALYWTVAQLLTHHASNGCNLRPGDLLASGTVSGPAPELRGCLLERTWRGTEPLALPTGETRRFLEDGDEVVMRGRCSREGFATIGFGECRGVILPASEPRK